MVADNSALPPQVIITFLDILK